MKLRTDDDIYRARLLYLGPPGYTLPFQLSYAQYGVFTALSAVIAPVVAVLTGTWWYSGVAIAAAVILTGLIWQHVDPDVPARKVIWVALTDWRRIGAGDARLPRLTARHIQFSTAPTSTKEAGR